MKWIIFQNVTSIVPAQNYYNSVKIAYLLNLKFASVGIDETAYFLIEFAEQMNLIDKVDRLIMHNTDFPKQIETLTEIKQFLIKYPKLKGKSSKQIVAYNKLKKNLELDFTDLLDSNYTKIQNLYQLPFLKELIDDVNFYFYYSKDFNLKVKSTHSDLLQEILQLNLPDSENGHPLFFLSNYYLDGDEMEIDFLNSYDKKAEDKNNFYGEVSYTFPLMDSLSSNELILTRKNLEKTTVEFRAKINEWASICYANPNTNLGLDYFKKELQPFLKSTQNEILENPLLQNTSSLTNKKLESQIIIGEAPIEKIWELYLDSKTIDQDVFDNLMKIKTEQFPKFEGRWPIVFYKLTDDALKDINDEIENDGVQSVRKSISLD